MSDRLYTVSELLQLNETSIPNNFKPVMGDGVKRSGNENEKAVKDIIKNVKEFNSVEGIDDEKRTSKVPFIDYNKTTMDANFAYEPDDKWKERVKKLATANTESDMADCYDTEGAEKFYQLRKEMAEDRNEQEENERIKGIVGRNNYDHKAKDYSNHSGYVNEAPMKRLKFKNTTFLNESQVLSRIPEEYKIDENRFYMQDKTGTDYLIECKADPFGFIHVSIEGKLNKKTVNEQLNRINELSNYKYSNNNCKVNKTQVNDVLDSLNNVRQLLKQ